MKKDNTKNEIIKLVSKVQLLPKPKKYIRGFKEPILIFTSNKQITKA
jgi:hypothetical protein